MLPNVRVILRWDSRVDSQTDRQTGGRTRTDGGRAAMWAKWWERADFSSSGGGNCSYRLLLLASPPPVERGGSGCYVVSSFIITQGPRMCGALVTCVCVHACLPAHATKKATQKSARAFKPQRGCHSSSSDRLLSVAAMLSPSLMLPFQQVWINYYWSETSVILTN